MLLCHCQSWRFQAPAQVVNIPFVVFPLLGPVLPLSLNFAPTRRVLNFTADPVTPSLSPIFCAEKPARFIPTAIAVISSVHFVGGFIILSPQPMPNAPTASFLHLTIAALPNASLPLPLVPCALQAWRSECGLSQSSDQLPSPVRAKCAGKFCLHLRQVLCGHVFLIMLWQSCGV